MPVIDTSVPLFTLMPLRYYFYFIGIFHAFYWRQYCRNAFTHDITSFITIYFHFIIMPLIGLPFFGFAN